VPTNRPRRPVFKTDWDAGARTPYTAERRRHARLAVIGRTNGQLTGAYGTGYLERLREDWPDASGAPEGA